MHLATFERDFWQLRSGEESHRQNPDSFLLPAVEERKSLNRGQAAKLIFKIETEAEDGQIIRTEERMWVIVAERVGNL